MDDLRIAWRPLGELIPYARNPRTHSDAQVAQIATSIREFGWTVPLLVDGENGIIAGHGRVLAARKLGLERVPVIELAHMSEAQRRAYVLADNQLALNAGWDEALLRLELADLSELGFELGLIGFADGELERLLAGEKAGLTEDDDAPALPEQAITQPGDLWVLGEHRVLCGDATALADVERVLEGRLANMTFTDPPYNVEYGNSAKDKLRGNKRKILNDDLGSGFEAFLHEACANMLAVTKGATYVCMSSSELHTLQRAFVAAGGKWSTFVIWAKNTFTLGHSDYQRQYEPILYGWPAGNGRYWCGARDQGDVWFFNKPVRNDLHPTMKPVALVERAIRNSSKTRDTVLDPFGGSGSTLIACEKAGRHGRLHGGYLVINHLWHELRRRLGHDLSRSTWLGRVIGRTVTFLAVVVAWVFFRADDFDAASRILAGMIGLNGVQLPASYYGLFGPLSPTLESLGWVFRDADGFHFGGMNQMVLLTALGAIAFLMPNSHEWTGYLAPNRDISRAAEPTLIERIVALIPLWRPTLAYGSLIGAMLCYCLLAAFAETPSEFLYFQF